MSFTDDDWDDFTAQSNERDTDAESVAALRKEVAALQELVTGAMDSGEEIAVQDNRRLLRERAEKDARAAAAAEDPRTLEALRKIDNPEDLERFLRANGGQ